MASRAASDKQEKLVRSLQQREENKRCINCNSRTTCVCPTFDIFVCTACSSVHREVGHRIKSIGMATFTPEEVKRLTQGGNKVCKQTLLGRWQSVDFPQPQPGDIARLRQWVNAVYVEKKWEGQASIQPAPQSPAAMMGFTPQKAAAPEAVTSASVPFNANFNDPPPPPPPPPAAAAFNANFGDFGDFGQVSTEATTNTAAAPPAFQASFPAAPPAAPPPPPAAFTGTDFFSSAGGAAGAGSGNDPFAAPPPPPPPPPAAPVDPFATSGADTSTSFSAFASASPADPFATSATTTDPFAQPPPPPSEPSPAPQATEPETSGRRFSQSQELPSDLFSEPEPEKPSSSVSMGIGGGGANNNGNTTPTPISSLGMPPQGQNVFGGLPPQPHMPNGNVGMIPGGMLPQQQQQTMPGQMHQQPVTGMPPQQQYIPQQQQFIPGMVQQHQMPMQGHQIPAGNPQIPNGMGFMPIQQQQQHQQVPGMMPGGSPGYGGMQMHPSSQVPGMTSQQNPVGIMQPAYAMATQPGQFPGGGGGGFGQQIQQFGGQAQLQNGQHPGMPGITSQPPQPPPQPDAFAGLGALSGFGSMTGTTTTPPPPAPKTGGNPFA